MNFKILGTGHCVPSRVVTNDEMSTIVETSDEWIQQRVGIKERRVCTTETAASLAAEAARNAMEMSKTSPEELDLILCATVSPDDASPSVACTVQNLLGATCPAIDINTACSGFVYALDTAAGFFARGKVKKMLVLGAERLSRMVNWTDRNICVIFADGAGAVVLGEGDAYLSSKLVAKGGDNVIHIPMYNPNTPFTDHEVIPPYIKMNGQETFKFAVNAIVTDLTDVIRDAGLTTGDITWFIPHQANARIIDAAARKFDIPIDRFGMNIDKYGNTSSASIPILMDEMNRAGKFKKGDYLALAAFGGGLTSAACVIRWEI